MSSLFDPVVSPEKLSPHFERLRTWDGDLPAREMLEEIFAEFDDPDGNFVEQFQTTGFDARFFELYLFAYLSRSGFSVDRSHYQPDFLVGNGGVTVAIEATTVNPATSGEVGKHGKKATELTPSEFHEYQKNELAIRFGSPLFSKLKKKYWELGHCRDIPLVLAIEAFHEEEALAFSDSALSSFLYGLGQAGAFSSTGHLELDTTTIETHSLGSKTIPSSFFDQPDTENISAVLFSNSGTVAKFSRMGYQSGFGNDSVSLQRSGFCFNPDPDAMDPTFFHYDMDAPPLVESWGQGLVVLHNPNAIHPLPRDFFFPAVQSYLESGVPKSDHYGWHPISSKTLTLPLGEAKAGIPAWFRNPTRIAVGATTKEEFQHAFGPSPIEALGIASEQGWFSDETDSFFGVLIRDESDGDWGYVVLARDQYSQFYAIDIETSLPDRSSARMKLQLKIAGRLANPQRLFSREDESAD